MDKTTLISVFQWLTLLNLALLLASFALVLLFKPLIVRWHGQWFGLSQVQLMMLLYLLLGGYKILIIVFMATPWLVLSLL